MLTQAMPSVIKALQGTLPPAALKQLTQSLGNCNMAVTQRGDVTVSPDAWTNVNNNGGAYSGDTWNVNDYANIINNFSNDVTNNNQNLFDFSTRQELATNNFYGGDTINNAGNAYFDNIVTNNLMTNNITVANEQKGDQGDVGPPGQPGQDGFDGMDGRDGVGRRYFSVPITFLSGANPRVEITPRKAFRTVMVGATFDPETCQINETTVDIEIVTGVEAKLVGLVPQRLRVLTP